MSERYLQMSAYRLSYEGIVRVKKANEIHGVHKAEDVTRTICMLLRLITPS